jgi:hypothetical protein
MDANNTTKVVELRKGKLRDRRDLTGEWFDRWHVIEYVGHSREGGAYWLCECICENISVILHQCLIRGGSKSCGCRLEETRYRKHGKTHSKEWRAWYVDKKIAVCPQWEHSFEQFLTDVGMCPVGEKLTLDRISNNRGYEPGNVRWADKKTQTENRDVTVWHTQNGKTMCLADWAREVGISASLLNVRIRNMGWSIEKALSTPARHYGQKVQIRIMA